MRRLQKLGLKDEGLSGLFEHQTRRTGEEGLLRTKPRATRAAQTGKQRDRETHWQEPLDTHGCSEMVLAACRLSKEEEEERAARRSEPKST